MACKNPKCPCNQPDPDGTNRFLMHLAEAALAIEYNQPRMVQWAAEAGGSMGYWSHAMKGLQKALKDHPADYVPAYLRKEA